MFFSCFTLLTDQNSFSDHLLVIMDNMCIAVVCSLDCDVINFEIYLSNQAVFLHDQKLKTTI